MLESAGAIVTGTGGYSGTTCRTARLVQGVSLAGFEIGESFDERGCGCVTVSYAIRGMTPPRCRSPPRRDCWTLPRRPDALAWFGGGSVVRRASRRHVGIRPWRRGSWISRRCIISSALRGRVGRAGACTAISVVGGMSRVHPGRPMCFGRSRLPTVRWSRAAPITRGLPPRWQDAFVQKRRPQVQGGCHGGGREGQRRSVLHRRRHSTAGSMPSPFRTSRT
jgi:hypothetical protein